MGLESGLRPELGSQAGKAQAQGGGLWGQRDGWMQARLCRCQPCVSRGLLCAILHEWKALSEPGRVGGPRATPANRCRDAGGPQRSKVGPLLENLSQTHRHMQPLATPAWPRNSPRPAAAGAGPEVCLPGKRVDPPSIDQHRPSGWGRLGALGSRASPGRGDGAWGSPRSEGAQGRLPGPTRPWPSFMLAFPFSWLGHDPRATGTGPGTGWGAGLGRPGLGGCCLLGPG